MLYAVTKLNSVDGRYVLVQYAAMSLSSVVCVSGFPVLVNSRPTHTTDDNDIWPHTVQEHNKHTSTEFNLVTA